MAQLLPYTQEQIDAFEIEEVGVRDGSSPNITFDRTGSIATREFKCAWPMVARAVRFFIGDAEAYVATGTDTGLSRLLPQSLPGYPGFYAVKNTTPIRGHRFTGTDYVDEVPPAGGYRYSPGSINAFDRGYFGIQYEKVAFEVTEDNGWGAIDGEQHRFVQFVPGATVADYITAPSGTQVYLTEDASVPNGIPVPFNTGIVDPTFRFSLKWFRLPAVCFGPGSILWARIFGDDTNPPWLGAVNSQNFQFIQPGQVLFEGLGVTYDPSMFTVAGVEMMWDLEFFFAVKSFGGWNYSPYFPNTAGFAAAGNKVKKYLVGKGSTWYAVADIPDGYSNYVVRDLNNLFAVGPLP